MSVYRVSWILKIKNSNHASNGILTWVLHFEDNLPPRALNKTKATI